MIESSNILSPHDEKEAVEFLAVLGLTDTQDVPMLNFRHAGIDRKRPGETAEIEIPVEQLSGLQREI